MLPGPGRFLAGRCLRQHPARSSPPPLRAGGTQEISRWWSAADPPDKPSRRALRPGGAREPWNPAAAPRPGDASSWADLPDCWQPRGRAPGGGRARAGAAWRRAVSARCHGARAPPGRTGGLGRWVRWFRCAPPPANLLRASGTTGTRGRERGRDRTKMSKLQRGVYAAETSAWHGKVRAMPTPFIPRRCGGVNAALPSSLRCSASPPPPPDAQFFAGKNPEHRRDGKKRSGRRGRRQPRRNAGTREIPTPAPNCSRRREEAGFPITRERLSPRHRGGYVFTPEVKLHAPQRSALLLIRIATPSSELSRSDG